MEYRVAYRPPVGIPIARQKYQDRKKCIFGCKDSLPEDFTLMHALLSKEPVATDRRKPVSLPCEKKRKGRPMRKELPHFAVGSDYGGSQKWCTEIWMNIGGCAAITACDSSIFFMLRKGRRSLYPYALNDISRRDYVDFTDIMKPYLYPREGGIDRLELYTDGFGRFLRDRGETQISMSPWPGEKGLSETKEKIKKQIDSGWLLPSLTLHHMRPSMQKFVWHWYILNGYHEQGETFLVKTVTYGAWQWLDFAELWNTGCTPKGGLILYEMP